MRKSFYDVSVETRSPDELELIYDVCEFGHFLSKLWHDNCYPFLKITKSEHSVYISIKEDIYCE